MKKRCITKQNERAATTAHNIDYADRMLQVVFADPLLAGTYLRMYADALWVAVVLA